MTAAALQCPCCDRWFADAELLERHRDHVRLVALPVEDDGTRQAVLW